MTFYASESPHKAEIIMYSSSTCSRETDWGYYMLQGGGGLYQGADSSFPL